MEGVLLLPFQFSHLLHSFTNKNWAQACAKHWGRCEHEQNPDIDGVGVAGLTSPAEWSPKIPQVPQKGELATVPSTTSSRNQPRLHLLQNVRLPSFPGRSEVIARKQRGGCGERRRGLPCGLLGLRQARQRQEGNGLFWTEMELRLIYWIGHFDWRDCSCK